MRLLCIGKYQFVHKEDGWYTLPAYGDRYWEKYLDVFDGIDVVGEPIKAYLDNGTLAKINDTRISVSVVPSNTRPQEFINDFTIKRKLKSHIIASKAVLIKPTSRKGMMAIKLCEKYKKAYMIELTGDLKLTLSMHKSFARRVYSPILHNKIIKSIKDCKYGLYVTDSYLQKVYPISGVQCGCTDTIILDPKTETLDKRIERINSEHDRIIIGMVASYHDSRKGIDTAIESLNKLHNSNVELHILGLGTQEDRDKWFKYASSLGVKEKLFFDPSLSGVEKVLNWNDNIDIQILPSRSEGLPRCIVEALSRACPCILSNACGMPELVQDIWLHDPSDADKLASLIDMMIDDKEKMQEAARINFKHSFDYTQDVLKNKRNKFLLSFKEYAINCCN